MNTRLTRRHFLRSSTALVALPFLESLGFRRFASAATLAAPPKRLVFLSFGLQVPRKWLAAIVIGIGVISIASVMFVIVDLDLPYGGVFGIPSTSMRNALADMQRISNTGL